MIEKQSLSDQRIIDCLNQDYGIEVALITFLPLGADMDASVYKVQSSDQVSYFVKLKRGHHQDIGVTIQLLLHNAGIQEIISPLKTKYGQPRQYIDDFTLIIYPFIEGQDGFVKNLTDEQWVTLGRALRKVHAFNVSLYELGVPLHEFDKPLSLKDQIRRESYSPKWRDTVRKIYASIDGNIIGENIVMDEIALKLLAFMKEHRLIIERLVDRAEQLCQKIQEQSPECVLCHSDIHAGNVLIQENGAIYLVDWDAPIMAPKERDLMFIGGGVGNVWNNPREEELFYKGYGKTEINRTTLAYYRHERIVEDIAIYSESLLMSMAGGADRLQMYQHFIDMFEPRGVVDIAFETEVNY